MRHTVTLVLSTILLIAATAQVFAQSDSLPRAYHTERFGALRPDTGIIGRYSGLTGYAAPDGREYALLGGYWGTYIVDVTEKPIRLVALVEGPESDWREIKTLGHYAYAVNETGGGIQIIDLSSLPEPPAVVKSDTSVVHTGHTISAEGKYIYVHGSDLNAGANAGTIIFDVSEDPVAPKKVGSFSAHYVHDAFIRNDTMYAAAIYDGKASIIYLGADRKNPVMVGEVGYPGAGTHNTATTRDGSYLLTTDEIGSTGKTLKIWDIRNLNSIAKVSDFTPEPASTVHNVFVKGELAFVSWYMGGTRIIDISDPESPVELGYFDAYPGSGPDYAGNWDVYPYLPSGKILASYMQSGLEVFTFDNVRPGRATGRVVDAVSKMPLAGVRLALPELGVTRTTAADGRFSFTGAVGTTGFTAYLPDYYIEYGQMQLKEEGNELEISLRPIPMTKYALRVEDEATGAPIDDFVYRVYNRNSGEGMGNSNPFMLSLPADSSYLVQVGAWGYQPRTIELSRAIDPSVPVRLKKGYADDAELDLGWSLGVPGDGASGGRWERGTPLEVKLFQGGEEVAVQPGEDATPGPGNRAFITGLSLPGEYSRPVYGGITTLLSPQFDLSSYSDPYINGYLWFSNDAWYTTDITYVPSDTMELRLSTDDGATWHALANIGASTGGWKRFSFRVRDVISPSGTMRFKIVVSDTILPSVVEAGLDDFSITEGMPMSVDRRDVAETGAVLRIAPNPARGAARILVSLDAPQRDIRLELFNALGERVMLLHEGSLPAGTTQIPVGAGVLPEGTYFWRLRLDDGSVASGRMSVVR